MIQIAERSTCWINATFKDTAGAAAVPTEIWYSVYCSTNKQVVRAETQVSPDSSVSIRITPSDNAILSDSNEQEVRTVVVRAVFGGPDDQIVREFKYWVGKVPTLA